MSRSLRRIDYHSARTERNPWTRAMAWNLLLSLVAGIPGALATDWLVVRSTPIMTISGRLFVDDRGQLDGFALDSPLRMVGWEQARPYGEFSLSVQSMAWGWPSVSHELLASATLSITRFDGAASDGSGRDRAVVASIVERCMRPRAEVDRSLVLSAMNRADDGRARGPLRLGSLLFNALVEWPIIYGAGAAGIWLVWVGAALAQVARTLRRRRLRARGRCPRCGHQVDGNLWSARCPECGEPLY
ncbi:MAG: zinc ribbon domain-containing protein [Phycisphaerales bacterium]|nr:zinc ribbon domain-containing protein [Phycisphaerales bacterium]